MEVETPPGLFDAYRRDGCTWGPQAEGLEVRVELRRFASQQQQQ